MVLGPPWTKHNPIIDWSTTSPTSWSSICHQNCLNSAIPTAVSISKSPPEVVHLSVVPGAYHGFKQVFLKDRALYLPSYRAYDCFIDLVPGAPLPTKELYNLSKQEMDAMETYVQESLAAGLVRTSSSPVVAGFFFVEKKNKTLQPRIDFRGLNDITVKNKYPLPLIDSDWGTNGTPRSVLNCVTWSTRFCLLASQTLQRFY